jgi:hypothetical protein
MIDENVLDLYLSGLAKIKYFHGQRKTPLQLFLHQVDYVSFSGQGNFLGIFLQRFVEQQKFDGVFQFPAKPTADIYCLFAGRAMVRAYFFLQRFLNLTAAKS